MKPNTPIFLGLTKNSQMCTTILLVTKGPLRKRKKKTINKTYTYS
uniref:Uncharacterized protein n=1 Tax=Rhizophora mucronata TaxID=61149 RepID=A0A2P2QGL1_RHIMU